MSKHALRKLPDHDFEAIASHFRALGEVSRLRIVSVLQAGEKSVSELVELTGLSQPNVSRHLQVLVSAGLIDRRKEKLNVLYRIVDHSLAELCEVVCRGVSQTRERKFGLR